MLLRMDDSRIRVPPLTSLSLQDKRTKSEDIETKAKAKAKRERLRMAESTSMAFCAFFSTRKHICRDKERNVRSS
jgi:hypothetical protein